MAGSLSLSPGGRQGQEHSGKCSSAFPADSRSWRDRNVRFSPCSACHTKAVCPVGHQGSRSWGWEAGQERGSDGSLRAWGTPG